MRRIKRKEIEENEETGELTCGDCWAVESRDRTIKRGEDKECRQYGRRKERKVECNDE
jgi:hypothetical protein